MGDLARVFDKSLNGERLDWDEALLLYREAPLTMLSRVASSMRHRHQPDNRVSYVIDRNVNYTDVCVMGCSFCAFHCRPGEGGYRLSLEQLREKARETKAMGGTGCLLQGGVNPALGWDDYLAMVSLLKEEGLWVHGFSPVEVRHMARLNGLGLQGTLEALRQAGLGSLPGGGAEILADSVRQRIAPRKGDAAAWLSVMEAAHEVGMHTTATMMFGIGESWEDRLSHLAVLRTQQDRALARQNGGCYTAFTAWPFQPGNTVWASRLVPPTPLHYIRTIAMARIYLDNFPHMQSSWVTMGKSLGQMALHYGCDDMGSLMLEENVVRAAGTSHHVDLAAILHLIRNAGFTPWQRDNGYHPIEMPSAS